MTADTELTKPNTTHPFFKTVDASLVFVSWSRRSIIPNERRK